MRLLALMAADVAALARLVGFEVPAAGRGVLGRHRPDGEAIAVLPVSPDGLLGQQLGHFSSFRRFGGLMLRQRSEEHTSELQSLMRISYAVFCLKKKKQH